MTSLLAQTESAASDTVTEEPVTPPVVAPVDTPEAVLATKQLDKMIEVLRQATQSLLTAAQPARCSARCLDLRNARPTQLHWISCCSVNSSMVCGLPQVHVRHRRLSGADPSLLAPAMPPIVDPIDHVLAVRD